MNHRTVNHEDREGSATHASRRSIIDVVPRPPQPAASLSTVDLMKEIGQQVTLLARTELSLAKNELRANLLTELKSAGALGVAVILTITAVNLFLVTGILALARVVPGPLAGLIVSVGVLLLAAIVAAIGWSVRVRRPLDHTRREFKENVRWSKERVA